MSKLPAPLRSPTRLRINLQEIAKVDFSKPSKISLVLDFTKIVTSQPTPIIYVITYGTATPTRTAVAFPSLAAGAATHAAWGVMMERLRAVGEQAEVGVNRLLNGETETVRLELVLAFRAAVGLWGDGYSVKMRLPKSLAERLVVVEGMGERYFVERVLGANWEEGEGVVGGEGREIAMHR